MEEHEQYEERHDHTDESSRYRHPPPGSPTEQPSRPNLRGSLPGLGLYEVGTGSRQAKAEKSVPSTRFGSLGSGTQVSALLLLISIALLALRRWVKGHTWISTTISTRNSRFSKKGTGSGRTSPGSLGNEELDPGPLYDVEKQASGTDVHGGFKAVKYVEPAPTRRGIRASTWSRKKRGWGAKVSRTNRNPRVGADTKAAGSMSNFPRSIDAILQRSVRGFRESWWTPSDIAEENSCADEEKDDRGDMGDCLLQPETQAFLNDHVLSRSSSNRIISPTSDDMRHLASPSTASAAELSRFREATDDAGTGSTMPGSMREQPPAVVSASGPMPHRVFKTLSLVSEEVELPLQAESSGSWHSEVFDIKEAVMETVQLVEEAPHVAHEIVPEEEDGPLSGTSDAYSLRVGSRGEEGEDEENNPLVPISPFERSPPPKLAEPASMTTRIGAILRGVQNISMALRGNCLARQCSLSNCEENRDLQWGRVLGEGKYGRVSLVLHQQFGPFAMKELTEEAKEEDRAVALNEMENFLSIGDNPNVIRVFAMDSTLPTRPIMMEAGVGDMFDIVVNDAMLMNTKARLLHNAACGFAGMHAKGKVHRDIKPGNIVIVGGPAEETLEAKVADFGLTCDIGMTTPPTTGTAGFIPVENLRTAIDAGPDADVFSFAVVMLLAFVLPECRRNNMFAHPDMFTYEEQAELQHIRARGDAGAEFELECRVMERTIDDISFQEFMLVPEKLKDSVTDKDEVIFILSCCFSPDRDTRPTMREVAEMLHKLME